MSETRFVFHVSFRIVCVVGPLQISDKLSIKALIKSVNNTLAMRKQPHLVVWALGGNLARVDRCVRNNFAPGHLYW